MGVLAQLAGMLVGRPMHYSEQEKLALREIILARTAKYHFPVISDMDFGHTAPQFTLPIGCRAEIDSRQATFEIMDAAVRDAGEVVVSLTAVVEQLEIISDGFQTYINTKSGEFVSISDDEMRMAERGSPLDKLADWEREMVETAIEIMETTDYLTLPNQFEIHEYDIMERFSYAYPEEHISDMLLSKIKGGGAFRGFKDTIHRYNIQDEWYAYRTKALEKIAIEWLEDNGLSYS
jgi:hypothetical protein